MPSKAAIALMVALLTSSLTACTQDVNSQLIEAGKKGETTNIEGLLAAGADFLRAGHFKPSSPDYA